MNEVTLHLRISPGLVRWGLASGLLSFMAVELASENVTLTTYYPAPSGIYTKMITTNNTFLARDGGNVGVGTTNPIAKLEVEGATAGLAIDNSAAGTPFIEFKNADTVRGRIETTSASLLKFYTGGSASSNERARIDSTGRMSLSHTGTAPAFPGGLTNIGLFVVGGIKAAAGTCTGTHVMNYPGNAVTNCPADTYATNATGFWAEYISMGGPTLETASNLSPGGSIAGAGLGQMYCCPCGGSCNP